MPIEFDAVGPTIDEQVVSDFEELLGRSLPQQYRGFLLTKNGGDPQTNHHPPSGPGDVCVRHFLSLGTNDRYESLVRYRALDEGRVPSEFLTVGYDEGGNLILISLEDGSISFWDHDWEAEEDESPTYRNVTRISGSIDAFLDELEPFEHPDEQGAWVAEYRRQHGLDT